MWWMGIMTQCFALNRRMGPCGALVEQAVEPMTKNPATQLRALDATKYVASELIRRDMSDEWIQMVTC